MNGLLIRVGIDASDGNWNAPVRVANGEFAYITITDSREHHSGLAKYYEEFIPALNRFNTALPEHLNGRVTHLDPDFSYLSYGDQGQRGRRICEHVGPGDFLAFFAAFRPVDAPARPLVYALIGILMVDEIVSAQDVPELRWHENAHTRRKAKPDDIVVRARREGSGRLRRCIPFGEYRDKAYRVRNDMLEAWGGLDIHNGYVQRSARLPAFTDARKFLDWFQAQQPELVAENNPS